MSKKKTILISTAEKWKEDSYRDGFQQGRESGRQELLRQLREILGITQLIGDLEYKIESHENDGCVHIDQHRCC